MMDDQLEGLRARLQECIDWAGSKRALAKLSGISEAQLYRYLSGESPLPVDRLFAIAEACGRQPTWLLTGQAFGGSLPGAPALPTTNRPGFDPTLLMQIAEQMDQLLLASGKAMDPQQRARALALVYDSMSLEMARRGEPMSIDKSLMVVILHFIAPLQVFNELETYHYFLERLAVTREGLSPQQCLNFDRMVVDCTRAVYENANGRHYFERMGQSLSAPAAQRMLTWVEQAQAHTGRPRLRWLDLGCGNGRHMAFLHKMCPQVSCVGVDSSSMARSYCAELEKAEKIAPDSVIGCDFRNLPFAAGEMDVVFCRMGLYSAPDVNQPDAGAHLMLKEAARVMKEDGLFYLISLHGEGQCFVPFFQFYTRATLERLCAQVGLRVVSFTLNKNPSDNTGVRGVDYSSFFGDSFEAVLAKA